MSRRYCFLFFPFSVSGMLIWGCSAALMILKNTFFWSLNFTPTEIRASIPNCWVTWKTKLKLTHYLIYYHRFVGYGNTKQSKTRYPCWGLQCHWKWIQIILCRNEQARHSITTFLSFSSNIQKQFSWFFPWIFIWTGNRNTISCKIRVHLMTNQQVFAALWGTDILQFSEIHRLVERAQHRSMKKGKSRMRRIKTIKMLIESGLPPLI